MYDPLAAESDVIRYIGDRILQTGSGIANLSAAELAKKIEVPGSEVAHDLILDLFSGGEVSLVDVSTLADKAYRNVTLTSDGWKRFSAEHKEGEDGDYCFIAMKFFDAGEDDELGLNHVVQDVVKPAVKDATGCDLIDMRTAQAGIIDNIMRARIKSAKFVIADLSHDNNGAYWEAGYAEGLGKTVIYVCERGKFKSSTSHFDTNHCTTLLWSKDDPERLRRELVDILRRSVDG